MHRHLPALLLTIVLCGGARAGSLEVRVTDTKGRPVEDAVVAIYPANGAGPRREPPGARTIDQIDQQYLPWVSVIEVGTPVSFPNQDNIRHHVYSFSDAKKFELPLYQGKPASPVVFDVPGTVVLGCNIHDWMLAYVYVVDTSWFATTNDEGVAIVNGLSAAGYRVEIQHPRVRGAVPPVTVALAPEAGPVEFQVKLGPDVRRRRPADY